MTGFDHFLFLLIVVVMPLLGQASYARLLRRAEEEGSRARQAAYRSTIVALSALTVMTLAGWFLVGRDALTLGLRFSPTPAGLMALLAAGVAALGFYIQVRRARGSADYRARVRQALGRLKPLLPHSDDDCALFDRVAVVAGIGEEIVYRGFLIWYLQQFLDLPMAIAGAAVLFGWAHFYQGRAGILKTGIAGLVFAILYVASGSLLPGMIAHFAVDSLNGKLARTALQDADAGGEGPSGDIETQESASGD